MVDKDMFKELEKLTPEERIKRLRQIEAEIEKEKNEQLKAAEALLEKSNAELEQESEDQKLEKLFSDIDNDLTDEDNLEKAVKDEIEEKLEDQVQYSIAKSEVDERIDDMRASYANNDGNYKNQAVNSSYQTEVIDQVKENWKAMGYEKLI